MPNAQDSDEQEAGAREKPLQPPKDLIGFCLFYTRDALPWLLTMSFLSALIAVGEVMLFGFLGQLVDWLTTMGREDFLAREGITLALMAGLMLLVLPGIDAVNTLIVHQTLLGNLPMIARWRMHKLLLGQSLKFYTDEFAGRISTKLMQTALAVRESVMKVLDIAVYVAIYFAAMMVMIATADWRLVLPLTVWLLAYGGLVRYFVPRLEKTSQRQADARSAMTGRIVDSYTNITTVKLFAHAGGERAYAREGMNTFLQSVHPQMRLVTQFQVLVYLLNLTAAASVAGIGISLWLQDQVSVGAIATAVALTLRINGMSQWIMWEVSALFENIGTIHDGMAMLNKSVDVVDRPDAHSLAPAGGAITFDAISFHYGKDKGVIEELSLAIGAGEKIGLVGRSGAGKTTLTNLLLRFYDVEKGRILIDDQDIASVTQDSLRAHIGMVTQDTSLLHRSIRENIAYGRPDARDEEIRRAIERASADQFIYELADQKERTGLDAHVGERGVKLSGGQRQRIAIARIFLKNAPILILDEATSALDSEVEQAIQENLFALMEGKTVIAIAHRLSTIAQMDRLIVLDQGQIVEQGTHEDLTNSGGLYADLWARQSGGFLGGADKVAAAE
ncbi:MAG: ABC transporter ATP-binding protein [Pseudomonadota bacterium]